MNSQMTWTKFLLLSAPMAALKVLFMCKVCGFPLLAVDGIKKL